MNVYINYLKNNGGLAHWEDLALKKSKLIYDVIDGSNGFYTNSVSNK